MAAGIAENERIAVTRRSWQNIGRIGSGMSRIGVATEDKFKTIGDAIFDLIVAPPHSSVPVPGKLLDMVPFTVMAPHSALPPDFSRLTGPLFTSEAHN